MNSKILEAINFAAVAHDGQKRKDGIIPYISHPFGVGIILMQHGYPEDVVIAGILHDIVEDTIYTSDDIKKSFGEKIAAMVASVTHDRTLASHDERFEGYLQNLEKSDNDARAVCLADMLHNRKSLLMELENSYDIWRALRMSKEKYLDESYRKLRIIKTTLNNTLVEDVEKELEKIEKFAK